MCIEKVLYNINIKHKDMDAIHEINFYNNFDLISQTLKDHDPQVVKSLNEIAVYVANLHL